MNIVASVWVTHLATIASPDEYAMTNAVPPFMGSTLMSPRIRSTMSSSEYFWRISGYKLWLSMMRSSRLRLRICSLIERRRSSIVAVTVERT
jgi:hypothetical protein